MYIKITEITFDNKINVNNLLKGGKGCCCFWCVANKLTHYKGKKITKGNYINAHAKSKRKTLRTHRNNKSKK